MDQTVDEGHRAQPLREVIRDAVRARIFEGQYAPGFRLVERDLAAEFTVSRLPVREALRMLQQEGLVTEPATRGSVVASLDEDQVEDLFSVRNALEVLACSLAAQRATPADIDRLRDLVRRAKDAMARGSLPETHALNSEFHDEVTRIANNPFLRSALEPLQGRMHWLFRHVQNLPELIDDHQLLLEAIATGDPKRAADQSTEHIEKYREQYPETV
ncbi:GntR family transcriptional regulator [Microbacterium capsulatum]|uniref:GntR family transcriptional regulator n=1 Tax=Microbacterium capsulatum TaxID=3041921 RepID=A0ABU0XF07_9MICO|nr:GntR family transcriptional regulator [Microbacterium sp. ASV81]MDQ4213517.1 GntR family transcriptional regulator [Microbacterium sp. ASV81]